MKVLATGGHAGTTALSVFQELRKRDKNIEIYWIGAQGSIEEKIYPKYDIKLYSIDAGRIQTKYTNNTIPLFLKIPISFVKAFFRSFLIKPNIIISFGGSISIPVAFYGFLFKIPVIIHEQTALVGRANKLASKFATIVAISRETSQKYFKNSKVVLTGNPINPEISKYIKNPKSKKVKSILITGGSRGSTWINNATMPIVNELSGKYKIYWQVGENNLNPALFHNARVNIFGQIDPQEMIKIIAESDIVVSRAGANTTSELLALKKPSILIPIPWVYLNEQQENAKYLVDLGLSRILRQRDLNPQRLLAEIYDLIENYETIINKTQNLDSPDLNASKKFVDLILNEIKEK